MGSTDCTNYAIIIAKRIFAKGETSIEDIKDLCLKKIEMYNAKLERTKNEKSRENIKTKMHKYTWHTSEGEYMNDQIGIGIEIAILHLYEQEIIRPILDSSNYDIWMNYMNDIDDNWEKFDEIKWTWQTGGRMKYINKEINYHIVGGG